MPGLSDDWGCCTKDMRSPGEKCDGDHRGRKRRRRWEQHQCLDVERGRWGVSLEGCTKDDSHLWHVVLERYRSTVDKSHVVVQVECLEHVTATVVAESSLLHTTILICQSCEGVCG